MNFAQALGYFLILGFVLAIALPVNWCLFGAFGIFVFFYNFAKQEKKTAASLPTFIFICLLYWLLCKRWGMLGLIIPHIIAAMKGA